MTPLASGAQDTRHGLLPISLLPVGVPSEPAAHDGLLLLAALTGHRGLLMAWLRFERLREQASTAGGPWGT